jgi:GNAT superfamily N-acetyltransferase
MLGAAFSSFAETYDISENGIELNGLWVDPDHRNKGISLMLIKNRCLQPPLRAIKSVLP